MTGLADNQIIFSRIDAQHSARIVYDYSQPRIPQRSIVDVLEIPRGRYRRWFNFNTLN